MPKAPERWPSLVSLRRCEMHMALQEIQSAISSTRSTPSTEKHPKASKSHTPDKAKRRVLGFWDRRHEQGGAPRSPGGSGVSKLWRSQAS